MNNEPIKSLNELLFRETDDATAYPVFVVLVKNTAVSQSAIEYVDLLDLRNTYIDNYDVSEFIGGVDDVNFTADEIEAYLTQTGWNFYNFEGETISFWRPEDEIRTDYIDRCFWTREEANEYCKLKGPNYYSYSIMADGVLQEVIKQTCKREIERT